jgi:hypothetical protein
MNASISRHGGDVELLDKSDSSTSEAELYGTVKCVWLRVCNTVSKGDDVEHVTESDEDDEGEGWVKIWEALAAKGIESLLSFSCSRHPLGWYRNSKMSFSTKRIEAPESPATSSPSWLAVAMSTIEQNRRYTDLWSMSTPVQWLVIRSTNSSARLLLIWNQSTPKSTSWQFYPHAIIVNQ